jgi:AraC-like DNA-binding protein
MITVDDIKKYKSDNRVLARAERFIYLAPKPELDNIISNYTATFPQTGMMSDDYTVIPHGCATLVYAYDQSGIHSELFGPMQKQTKVGAKANKCSFIFIVEFQPAGLAVLTGASQKKLLNKVIPFESVDAQLNTSIIKAIDRTKNLRELIDAVEKLFLSKQHFKYPSRLELVTQMIIENMGNVPNAELAKIAALSERQLNRVFDEYVGMSLKAFSRLVRINKAIKLLYDPANHITDVCYQSGFYDLAHFIHDFKSICTVTPQEYRNKMADFYSEIAKF